MNVLYEVTGIGPTQPLDKLEIIITCKDIISAQYIAQEYKRIKPDWTIEIREVFEAPGFGSNEAGFSILEIIFTLALTLISSLAIMSLQLSSIRSERNVASLQDFDNLQDRIKMFVSNPNLCPSSLKTSDTKSIFLDGEIITAGTKLSSGSTITSVNLTLVSPTLNPNEYSAYINIVGSKNPVVSTGSVKTLKIPVTVTLSTTAIIACSLLATNAASPTPTPTPSPTPVDMSLLCIQLGGSWGKLGNSANYSCTLK